MRSVWWWRKTTRMSPPKPSPTMSASCDFRWCRHFINVLLAKSVLLLAKDDLANFSQEVDLNHARLVAGDLAEGDYLKMSLAEASIRAGRVIGAVEPGAGQGDLCGKMLGYQSVADDFDVTGTLAHNKHAVQLEDLEKQALANRPDLQAAHSGVKLANDTVSLAFGNRAKDWTWATRLYLSELRTSMESAFRCRSIFRFTTAIKARSRAARRPCSRRMETESSTQVGVLTDVVNAYYGLRPTKRS